MKAKNFKIAAVLILCIVLVAAAVSGTWAFEARAIDTATTTEEGNIAISVKTYKRVDGGMTAASLKEAHKLMPASYTSLEKDSDGYWDSEKVEGAADRITTVSNDGRESAYVRMDIIVPAVYTANLSDDGWTWSEKYEYFADGLKYDVFSGVYETALDTGRETSPAMLQVISNMYNEQSDVAPYKNGKGHIAVYVHAEAAGNLTAVDRSLTEAEIADIIAAQNKALYK